MPEPRSKRPVAATRRLLAVAAAALIISASFACSSDPTKSASAGSGEQASGTPAGSGTRVLPKPVELPPVAERAQWFTITAPEVAVDDKPEDAERAELDARRRAALPDGPQFDSRARVQEPEPAKWIDLAVDVEQRRNLNPMRISRANAVIAVAMHDAVVQAAKSGIVDERNGPDGSAPTTLPADVVAAGAAWRSGTKLFPAEARRFDVLAAAQKRRSAADGKVWPSTYDAAWAYGVAVADQVLAQAATDGSAAPAQPYAAPAGATWEPTPGLFAPALEPQAGNWRPWNMSAPDQFKQVAPPEPGTKEFDAALEQVKRNVAQLSDPQNRIVKFWDMGPGTSSPAGYWIQDVTVPLIESSPADTQVTVLATVATALADAGISAWNNKYAYGLGRPVTFIRQGKDPADAQWLPAIPTPPFPSYMSGHSTYSSAAAVALGGLYPALAERLAAGAAEAGDSRVLGGIHYWFDNATGLQAGGEIGRLALQRLRLDGNAGLPKSKAVLVDPDAKPRDADVGSAGIRLDS